MGFNINISDSSGVITSDQIKQIVEILAGHNLSAAALHKRAIPETARDVGAHSKYHLVWVADLDETTANAIAETIRQQLSHVCQVRKAQGA